MKRGNLRIRCGGAVEQSHCLVKIASISSKHAKQMSRVGLLRITRKHLAVKLLGSAQGTGLVITNRGL